MLYKVDNRGSMPTVNYEPSVLAGLAEADDSYTEYRPQVSGVTQRASIDRTNNYAQAGERYRSIEQWERNDLVLNLVDALSACVPELQTLMVEHLALCDEDFGRRVAEGIGIHAPTVV